MKAEVLESIKRSAAVPSMPQVVVRFLEVIQDPNFDYADVVKALSVDAGTVGEVLRLANSSLFGVRNKVTNLRQALTLLGPKRTRSLVLGRYLVETMGGKSIGGFDMSYYWRRSLAGAVVAAHFAEAVLPRHREEIFISALLADIGIPILADAMPGQYWSIVDRYCPYGEAITEADEREAVEVTHGEVSSMVLTYWSLPDLVTRSVNLHQCACPGDNDEAKVARILNSSDRVAKLLCEIPDVDLVVRTCIEAVEFVGASINVLADLMTRIEGEVEELATLLRIDVIPTSVYELIAKTVQEQLMSASPAAD